MWGIPWKGRNIFVSWTKSSTFLPILSIGCQTRYQSNDSQLWKILHSVPKLITSSLCLIESAEEQRRSGRREGAYKVSQWRPRIWRRLLNWCQSRSWWWNWRSLSKVLLGTWRECTKHTINAIPGRVHEPCHLFTPLLSLPPNCHSSLPL